VLVRAEHFHAVMAAGMRSSPVCIPLQHGPVLTSDAATAEDLEFDSGDDMDFDEFEDDAEGVVADASGASINTGQVDW
jgi:hypothetical protein